MAIEIKPKVAMPEQSPEARIKNFNEVPLGYTEKMAQEEAVRCIMCKKPQCISGCPVEIDIPAFIQLIIEGKYAESARKIKETNTLPAICGRVCPQETQCELKCVLSKKFQPVAIGRLERFVADYEREHNLVEIPKIPKWNGKKVAIIGSGPGGLTCAGDLALMGYKATIFEALHQPGGVLIYGIPEFRLPKEILRAEVGYLQKLGAEIKTNYVIGKIKTIDEILKEYVAVFICTGAGLPVFMGIEGENSAGIYSANEFLTRVNLMRAYRFGEYDTPVLDMKRVAVLGAGNTAMDAARCSLRLGAEEVLLVYRRSRTEAPARIEEIHHAEEEGIKFHFLTNPTRYISAGNGHIKAMECLRMELGEPDSSGRRRPIPIQGSEFIMEVDTVLVAIGAGANPLLTKATPDIAVDKKGYIIIDEELRTSKKWVYAGGDIVTGSATVIEAMGSGKRAARTIDKDLKSI